MRLSLNMSLIDTRTRVAGSIVAVCTITDDTRYCYINCEHDCVRQIFVFVATFHPGAPAPPRVAAVGFPGHSGRSARGSTSKHAQHTALPAHHDARDPSPRGTPLAYPQYHGRSLRPEPRFAFGRQPSQGCGLVGRRVGRRIQVQMQSASRRPRQPTPCRRRRGSPRASSRSSLGPILRVELRGSEVRLPVGPPPSALCLCGPAPEMNCTARRVRTF